MIEGGMLKGKAKLAYMANQIATFFGSAMPHDEAVAGVADHLNKFWEPRMRRQLFETIESGGAGLNPLVIECAAQVKRPAALDPKQPVGRIRQHSTARRPMI